NETFLASHAFGEELANNDRDHGPEVTDHRQLARCGISAVNVPVATAHRSLTRAQISARHIEQRLAESGAPRLIANERREDIALLQEKSAGHAHCFLSTANINSAGDQSATIEAGQFLLEDSGLQHPAKGFEVARRWCGLFGSDVALGADRLKHQPI